MATLEPLAPCTGSRVFRRFCSMAGGKKQQYARAPVETRHRFEAPFAGSRARLAIARAKTLRNCSELEMILNYVRGLL